MIRKILIEYLLKRMNNLKEYIYEKLRINKSIKKVFDKESFIDLLDKKYKISKNSFIIKYITDWAEDNNVSKFEVIGWQGINNLMQTKDAYIENYEKRNELAKEIIKNGKEIDVTDDKDNNDDNIKLYYTDTNFLYANKNDISFSIIVTKL